MNAKRTLATIMFTDMVGYTALMQQDELQARKQRGRHREVLEQLHEKYDGRIIQYFGDGTLSIFFSSVQAVACAVEMQQLLKAPIEVPLRIGIHSGEIIMEKEDIIGDAVNLASRIESFSVPGAVMISAVVYDQIKNQPQFRFHSLGTFNFKNVESSFEIYALTNDNLVVPNPSELEGKGYHLEATKHNLPQQLTSFIGREREIEEIRTLIQKKRLVTLTGTGGTGKTRLALKVAEPLAKDFKEGLFWIPLASISDLDSVKLAMIKTLGLIQTPNQESVDLLINFLKEKELLLILDNFEHIMSATSIVRALLKNCPQLKFLVTSRIVLNLQMEQEYALRPLAVPVLNGNNRLERLLAYPSMDLFCQRAKAVKLTFDLNDDNVVDVASICQRLDGLPLAIELAAARIKLFSPRTLLTRLDHHLDLLKANNPDRPERHHTLRRTISWSYELLDEEERRLFNRLSVFSGGCYLEAIEAVCGQDDLEVFEIVDHLFALVSKSLVNQEDDSNGEPRFYLLETIRTFAREQLAEQEDPEKIREAHGRYFVARAEEAQPHLTGSEQVYWLSLLEEDLDNFRGVFNWSIDRKNYELAFRLGIALWRLWISRGMLKEGVNNAQRLLDCPTEERLKNTRSKIVSALIATYFHTADFAKSLPFCKENLTYWRAVGNEHEIANNLNHLGFAFFNIGELESGVRYTEEAMTLCKHQNDIRGQAVAYNNFGWGYLAAGQPQVALINLEKSLQLRRELKDQRGIGFALVNLARAQTKLGRFREAEQSLQEGLALLNKNRNKVIYFWGIIQLGLLYYVQNKMDECEQLLLQKYGSSNPNMTLSKGSQGWLLILRGFVAEHRGAHERADSLIYEGIQLFLEASHQKYDGRIIQSFGDGTLSIFSSSVNAVQCAVEIQAALREPVEVPLRIGIHAGDIVIEKDNIIGDAVNLASRIESFSVSGAVLISEAVFEQIENQAHLSVVSLGQFSFKNVKKPTEVYALTNDGLVVPNPGELEGKGHRQDVPKHNLPQQLTSFIGREQEIVEIITLVQKEKLLTLTGPGGTGKTRLVLKVAENLAGDFKDGVFWIPLASVSDLDSVKLAMIKTLGLIQIPAVNSVDLLINFLREKELLLVLDNFEHMMEAASIVQALLQNCPALKLLITSRIVLNLQMEQEYPLRPLQVPVLNGNNQVERLQGYPSMDLFCQRAKAVKPNFHLDNRNAVDVAKICHRLDGLPLAIELAAARIKIFSPHALLMRLDRHLDLLRAENPDRPVRHHTLRQTISWSYQLLSEEERRLFSRLAVFSGGCYLEAVESVCCQDDLDEFAIVDQFFALVNKSLVNREEDFNGEARFYLLETIRAFALEKLEKEEEPENVREAHALYFVAKAEEAQSHLTGSEQVYWFSLLERDLGNFREAFNWSIYQRRYDLAFRLGIGLWRLWITRDMLQEGLNNAQRLLECPIEEDLRPFRAKIVGALIATYFSTGEISKALPLCRENLAFWQQMGDEKEIANNLNHLGFALIRLGEMEAGIRYTNEALGKLK